MSDRYLYNPTNHIFSGVVDETEANLWPNSTVTSPYNLSLTDELDTAVFDVVNNQWMAMKFSDVVISSPVADDVQKQIAALTTTLAQNVLTQSKAQAVMMGQIATLTKQIQEKTEAN